VPGEEAAECGHQRPCMLKRVPLANVQEGVPEAIATLIEGGMRVWMITGDKQETAVRPADLPCTVSKRVSSSIVAVLPALQCHQL